MTKSTGKYKTKVKVIPEIRLARVEYGEYFCFHCQQYKPFSKFGIDRNNSSGVRAKCLDCFNERRAEMRDKNKDKEYRNRIMGMVKNTPKQKICSCCKEEKLSKEFSMSSSTLSGLYRYCKACVKIKHKIQREQRKDKIREYEIKYREKYPERGRITQFIRRTRKAMAGGAVDPEQARALISFYSPDNKCIGCKRFTNKLELDHVVPVVKGGTGYIYNMQPICRKCNRSKFTDVIDYRPDKGSFAMELHGGRHHG